MGLRRVRKRSGDEVPFDKAKIALAVRAAQTACGEEDPPFADEVADLVELTLRRRYAWRGAPEDADVSGLFTADVNETTGVESVPEIEEIQDLVEIGLIELGRAAVAKAYILYRDRRNRARASVGRDEHEGGQIAGLRVREAHRTSGWSKGRIIAALVQEADLSRAQAEEVAARVEARVVASGLRRLSTALIREVVDNELVALGLSGALARQAPVAVPRHDLRELLAAGDESGVAHRAAEGLAFAPSVRDALGGELLGRYALDDVLDEATVERHLSGALHVEDLRAPHLHLSQAIPSELLQRGEPSAHSAFDALDEVAALCGSVSRGLVLEQPGPLLLPLARSLRSDGGSALSSWLLACAALARGAGRRIDLANFGLKSGGLFGKLCEELERLDGNDHLPRLFVERAELESFLSARDLAPRVERLLQRGLVLPTWAPKGERFVGPAGLRRARELGGLACGGAVALNVARIGRQAGPWREDLALEGLAHLVESAVDALAQLSKFQRETRGARRGEARGRVAYALCPVGLAEALRALGDGELRADQGARLLGLLSEAARRFSAEVGLAVHLSPHFGEVAAARFALCDADLEDVHQGLLFTDLEPRGNRAPSTARRYGVGYALGPLPGQPAGAAEAQLLATVPVGSWQPLALDRGAERSQLSAWQRFCDERDTIRRSVPVTPAGADSFFSPGGDSPSRAV